tara:strand:+ start:47 stop:634 length:588 start_codon:yes stop_codon:yes gene_type:complete
MALTRLGPNQAINLSTNTTGNLNLASQVTGTLPAANGGTGVTSYTPGKVGQVIQNVITSGNTAATSTTFTATSHLVQITPTATNSNVMLFFSFSQGTQTNNRYARFRIYRDIGGAGYSALTNGVDGEPHEQAGTFKASASGQITGPCTLQFYDDPATTSQCTYKVYISLQDTTGTVNIYGEDDNYGYATAMEVLA